LGINGIIYENSRNNFDKDELELLNKGMNFINKPQKPPLTNIIAEIETAIKRFPEPEQEIIRQECKNKKKTNHSTTPSKS
jgi:hypothetical protein